MRVSKMNYKHHLIWKLPKQLTLFNSLSNSPLHHLAPPNCTALIYGIIPPGIHGLCTFIMLEKTASSTSLVFFFSLLQFFLKMGVFFEKTWTKWSPKKPRRSPTWTTSVEQMLAVSWCLETISRGPLKVNNAEIRAAPAKWSKWGWIARIKEYKLKVKEERSMDPWCSACHGS